MEPPCKRRKIDNTGALYPLPNETQIQILQLLDVQSLFTFSLVDKKSNSLANDPISYRHLKAKAFPYIEVKESKNKLFFYQLKMLNAEACKLFEKLADEDRIDLLDYAAYLWKPDEEQAPFARKILKSLYSGVGASKSVVRTN